MSFDAKEKSEFQGEPQELYWFMRSGEEWFYTSGAFEIVLGLNTYVPLAGLKHGDITRGRERSRNQLSIEIPKTAALVQEFIRVPKQTSLWLKLFKLHAGETDFRITYQGRVRAMDINTEGSNAVMTLDDLLASTRKNAFRFKFQNQCNHFLYDANCKLVELDFTHVNQTVITVNDDTLTVNNVVAAGGFINGQVRLPSGERRLVIGDTKVGSTHTLTLLQPFEGLQAGNTIILIEGACRNTFPTCPESVKINYGGYPLVPTKDPFKSVI